jgi:hypothetical protein
METNTRSLSYVDQFFLEWEMFQTKAAEKIKTNYIVISYFSKIMTFMRDKIIL